MFKKYFALPCTALIFVAMCACSSSDSAADFEASDLACALAQSDCFSDLLSELDDDIALSIYDIPAENVADLVVYLGTGATAEEIAVFKAVDESAAKAVATAMEQRISSQIVAYENYVPSEVPKLENAIIWCEGCSAVYITAEDEAAAQDILSGFID